MSTAGSNPDLLARPRASTGLPAQPTRLIGRSRELLAGRTLLSRKHVRLVTLTGPPGVGKTRLAIALAAALQSNFPDGVRFLDLSALTDPRLVAESIARGLDLPEVGTRSPLERLQAAIGTKSLLLLIDNFEQVAPAAGDLAALLAACSRLKLLVTSRLPLRLRWEQVVPVQPLPLPDLTNVPSPDKLGQVPAVALFVDRAQAALPDFRLTAENAMAVAELCAWLDGLPLAIELAASRVKLLSPRAMRIRFAARLDLLKGGANDHREGHQTLRAAIEGGYGLLPPAAQALFRGLAVFAGGATLEAVDAVVGPTLSGQDLLSALDMLIDQSLLRREAAEDEPRFRFLETIREYALDQLAESGAAEDLHERHARYFRGRADELASRLASEWGQEARRLLIAEHENLCAALAWAIDRGRAELALGLGAAAWPLWASMEACDEGRAWLARILAVPGANQFARSRATCLLGAAWLAMQKGDFSDAETLAGQARELADRWPDSWERTAALHVLGSVSTARCDVATARVRLGEALAVARIQGYLWPVATILGNLAEAEYLAGAIAEARATAEEALTASRELGFAPYVAHALQTLGQLSYLEGDLSAARRYFTACGEQWRLVPSRGGEALLGVALGHLAVDEGDGGTAREAFVEAMNWWRQLGYSLRVIEVLEGFAHLAAGRDADRALRLAGAAEALRERVTPAHAPVNRLLRDRWLAPARAALGDDAAAVLAGGQELTLEEAIALALAEPSEGASPASTAGRPGWAGASAALTPRERQVAALLGQGYTNRQIAVALVIAESTAHLHVVHLLHKLGFHTRAQAAAWAVTHGLVPEPRRE